MRYNYANMRAVNNEHVTSLVSILDLRPKGFELFFFKTCCCDGGAWPFDFIKQNL